VAKGFRRRLKDYRLLRQPQAAVVLGGASKKQPWTVEETETSLIVRDANGQGARLRLFRGGAGKTRGGQPAYSQRDRALPRLTG
jgi:hypothetical protein